MVNIIVKKYEYLLTPKHQLLIFFRNLPIPVLSVAFHVYIMNLLELF